MTIYTILKTILIAFIQGFTEIFPISSSAHNAILAHFLNDFDFSFTNEIVLHLGSFLGVVVFLFKDLILIIKNIFHKDIIKLIIYLFFTSLFSLVGYLIFKNFVDSIITNIFYIGIFLIITTFILLFTYFNLLEPQTNYLSLKSSVIIGLIAIFQVIPGISRSSLFMYSGSICKIKKNVIIKYSLFMFLISIIGSFILNSNELFYTFKYDFNFIDLICIILTSIITFCSLYLFYNKFKRKHYLFFALYTLIIGVFCLFL